MSWEMVRLGKVFSQIKNGASIKQSDGLSGIPITRIETISNSTIDKTKFGFADIFDESFKEFYLENGDILMSHINSWIHLGKNAIVENIDTNIIHGMNLLLLKPNKNEIFPKFAKYYFDTELFRNQIYKISNQSVNQSSFSVTKLKDLQIPLPPLSTQKRIAEILDAADALRRKDQELLKKYDELAQAIFIDMFGDPVKNEKGWEVKTIGEITDVGSGGTPSREIKEYYGGHIPWVKTTEVNGYIIKSTEENITEDALKNSSCKLYPKGSVIIAMYGQGKTRGQVALLGIEATTNQACGVIKPCKEIVSFYLFSYLKLQYEELRKLGRGGNQENLNSGMIKNFQIMIPPIDLQILFEERIKIVSNQIFFLEKAQSETLFNSLLQKAFKGELVQ